MGYRYRHMYYLTGLPGWMRFGFSPGWLGRSPTGLPPTAQWLLQSGFLPQYMQYLQTQPVPTIAPPVPAYSEEQEKQMLEQQIKVLETQLEALRRRLEELSK
ncbi:TPA: hypothetical protein EYP26_05450 [Candidatus Bathyarchaeota archaeon]|nr:hypothetical protein [Candidatus Bathyarchaeota archaeon]